MRKSAAANFFQGDIFPQEIYLLKIKEEFLLIVSDAYLEHQNFFKSTREIFENPILRTSNCSKYCRPCSKCSVVLSYPWEEANLEHMPNFRELPKYVVSNMSLVHLKLLARILEIPKLIDSTAIAPSLLAGGKHT